MNYKTKDVWVAMVLQVLGEKLTGVEYDPITKKVFFAFETSVPKGKAIEAIFASSDRRLALPVVDMQRAYEYVQRLRFFVQRLQKSIPMEEIHEAYEKLLAESKPAPHNIDEAMSMLSKWSGGEDNE